jgi:hypothetical protein
MGSSAPRRPCSRAVLDFDGDSSTWYAWLPLDQPDRAPRLPRTDQPGHRSRPVTSSATLTVGTGQKLPSAAECTDPTPWRVPYTCYAPWCPAGSQGHSRALPCRSPALVPLNSSGVCSDLLNADYLLAFMGHGVPNGHGVRGQVQLVRARQRSSAGNGSAKVGTGSSSR